MKKQFFLTSMLGVLAVTSLAGCAGNNDNKVIIYTAAEEERIQFMQEDLKTKFSSYDIIFQSLGTGALVSKLQSEGQGTECDIFYDLEATNAEIILNGDSNIFYDLSNYDFSIYDSSVTSYTSRHHKFAVNGKTDGTITVNKKVLNEHGLEIPTTYNDLLDSKYKGLISMPNPKSSGTGFAFYNGLVSKLGEIDALSYFDSLNSNIKEYTTSGSAPIKAVDRGDIAVGVGLLWQNVNYANKNSDLQVVFLDNEASYNLFTMGIINGKESKKATKDVFDYLYNDLNKRQVVKFNPDKIYSNQGNPEITNYPTNFNEIAMKGLYDFNYKQDLLDKWKF